jgi:hypothetical protein
MMKVRKTLDTTNFRASRPGLGDADNDARSRHQSVIGTKYGRAQSADAMNHVEFGLREALHGVAP